jgi:hypothetical protein
MLAEYPRSDRTAATALADLEVFPPVSPILSTSASQGWIFALLPSVGRTALVRGRHTTVSLHWVAERLNMGHYTRVTQAVSRVGRRPAKRHAQLRRQLERQVKQE